MANGSAVSLTTLCPRPTWTRSSASASGRGFVYQSAEIYGGFRSTYDYGPLGSLLLRNVKEAWVRAMVQQRDDVVLIDATILGPPRSRRPAATWPTSPTRWSTARTASSASAGQARRSEHVPELRGADSFTEARAFNLMFKTQAGPVEDDGADATSAPRPPRACSSTSCTCCRPTRKKPPFGIAQVGKSFRNEITPQNWIFRTREFEQMELEFFVPAGRGPAVVRVLVPAPHGLVRRPRHSGRHAPAPAARRRRAVALLRRHVRRRVQVSLGLGRAQGIAQRTDFDLKAHSARSGEQPRLLRPADQRTVRALRDRTGRWRHAHDGGGPARRVRRGRRQRRGAHRPAAPSAPRPLQGGRVAAVEEGHADAARPGDPCDARRAYMVDYDETQTIGKRYRRQDEIGTPLGHGRLRLARDDAVTVRTPTRPSRSGCRSPNSSARSPSARRSCRPGRRSAPGPARSCHDRGP